MSSAAFPTLSLSRPTSACSPPFPLHLQVPLLYQQEQALFCVRATYTAIDPAKPQDGLRVQNQARRFSVSLPPSKAPPACPWDCSLPPPQPPHALLTLPYTSPSLKTSTAALPQVTGESIDDMSGRRDSRRRNSGGLVALPESSGQTVLGNAVRIFPMLSPPCFPLLTRLRAGPTGVQSPRPPPSSPLFLFLLLRLTSNPPTSLLLSPIQPLQFKSWFGIKPSPPSPGEASKLEVGPEAFSGKKIIRALVFGPYWIVATGEHSRSSHPPFPRPPGFRAPSAPLIYPASFSPPPSMLPRLVLQPSPLPSPFTTLGRPQLLDQSV